MSDFDAEKSIVAWEKVVETQMHFNDICIRIRSLFLTAIVAIIGAAGYIVANDVQVVDEVFSIHLVIVALFVGWLTCYLFYLMDFKHYHQYLRASVMQGELLEESLASFWNGATLAKAITEISSNNEFGKKLHEKLMIKLNVVEDARAKSDGRLHSDGRIQIFYRLPLKFFKYSAWASLLFLVKIKGGNAMGWAAYLIANVASSN